ncbi:MAG TPA: alpha/beta hydrolase [Oceanobacillus sp.]|nr:alpha/beta hydrolase [Oceanobacillus sp.]
MKAPPPAYTIGSVTSEDGTNIGYRQLGDGPGLILVHGGMQASQNFMKLAAALADTFTVYVPDRRGRGLSGPYSDHHTIQNAVDDIQALLDKTGAHYVFGLSAGAVISLHSALMLPDIHKLALYEPPLTINGAASSDWTWTARYERELAQGKLGAAMVTIAIGTEDSRLFRLVPRFIMEPLMSLAIKAEAKEVKGDDVPLEKLIPTMHYDIQMVLSTENTIDNYKNVTADVLLLGGSNSAAYLKLALDRLERLLPRVRRVEIDGVGHLAADNGGKPERVA